MFTVKFDKTFFGGKGGWAVVFTGSDGIPDVQSEHRTRAEAIKARDEEWERELLYRNGSRAEAERGA